VESLVVALSTAPVRETRVRAAPGTNSPCGSFTVPVRDAPDWAHRTTDEREKKRSKYGSVLVITFFRCEAISGGGPA
jgi:hypothetical protein